MEEIAYSKCNRHADGGVSTANYDRDGRLISVQHRSPVSGENHAFTEAVQREVSRQLAAVAEECRRRAHGNSGAVLGALMEVVSALEAVACDVCHGTHYDYHTMGPCPACNGSNTEPHSGAPSCLPSIPAVAPARLSPCCQAETFEADGRRVCGKCRLTRPL